MTAISLLLGTLAIGQAQATPPTAWDLPKPKLYPLERYYQYPLLHGRSPSAPALSPDGRTLVFGWNRTGQRRLDVWTMDYPDGEPRQIVEADAIPRLPRQDDTRTEREKREEVQYDGGISGFVWSPDSREILFQYRGRVWLVNADGTNLRTPMDTNEGLGNFTYSPDGRYIGFMRGANVFRLDRANGAIRQLTFLSAPNTAVTSYSWSPDSRNLVVLWADSTRTGTHFMVDFSRDRATTVGIRRDWNGDRPFNRQVGLVSADGGIVRFVEGFPRYMWVQAVEWAPDSATFAVSYTGEDYGRWFLSAVPVSTLKKSDAVVDRAPRGWLPWWRPVIWTRDSQRIVFGTEVIDGKWGFRSLFSVKPDGSDRQAVYAKDHDVLAALRPRDSDRMVMVTAARSPLTTEITILEPDGQITTHVPVPNGFATEKQFDDVAEPMVSHDGTRIASLGSASGLPRELYAVEPAKGRITRSQSADFAKIKWAEHRPVQFRGPDGRMIHATLILPPNIDRRRKHPAFLHSMYANGAKLAWNGYFENYAATELGFVVLRVDFRASYGYGGDFNTGYFQKMGIIDTDEAVAARDYLASLGYVDTERIGCWGWSYGGFLTAMIMTQKPGVFRAGVAVAMVADWKHYNEGYTVARLGTIKGNEKVYERTSPITHAAGLRDRLLIVHGLLDDNTLFEDTARFMQRLIETGRHFDVMVYPRDDHGIWREEASPHVHGAVMRYLWQHLGRR